MKTITYRTRPVTSGNRPTYGLAPLKSLDGVVGVEVTRANDASYRLMIDRSPNETHLALYIPHSGDAAKDAEFVAQAFCELGLAFCSYVAPRGPPLYQVTDPTGTYGMARYRGASVNLGTTIRQLLEDCQSLARDARVRIMYS